MKTWMQRIKVILLWLLAFVLTAGIAVYQRLTGPTHPVRGKEIIAGHKIHYRFLRSHVTGKPLPVVIHGATPQMKGLLLYKRYPSRRPEKRLALRYKAGPHKGRGLLVASLPSLPPAGKWEYAVALFVDGKKQTLHQGKTIVARYRGDVPALWLILHVIFMFLAILFALRTGLEALRRQGDYRWLVYTTLALTLVGGLILGPIVQKYAFGDFWTGFPYGTDLTDNKILIAVLCWGAAAFTTWRKMSRWWVVGAVLLMTTVYLIPHSALGSELDPETGKMRNLYSSGKVVDARCGFL